MRALAGWILRSRMHAAAASVALCVSGWLLVPLLPLLSCMSGAATALVTLRHGIVEGALVAALSAGMLALVSMLVHGDAAPALWTLLLIWLPAQLCAAVLRYTRSQGWALVTAALLAAAFAGATRMLTGDVRAWWRRLLDAAVEAAREGGAVTGIAAEQLDAVAGMLNSLVAASLMVTSMLTVLLARHWQATLYNPGGFGAEFRFLQLPRLLALTVVGALLATLLLAQQLGGQSTLGYAVDLLCVSVCALAFHGLALVHHEVKRRGVAAGWLVGLYALLLLMPFYVAVLLAATGLADVVLDFRVRAALAGREK